jgi:3-hydroxyisobutyrate dehydrogenase-like beta-hydroxyacid dehydrogenase
MTTNGRRGPALDDARWPSSGEAARPAGFRLPLGLKDIQLVLQAAADHTAPMPMADLLRDRLLSAMAKGRQDVDWSALALGAVEDAGLSPQA